MKSMRAQVDFLEGGPATVYMAVVDQETFELWPRGLATLFPGFLSSPSFYHEGVGIRAVSFNIEGIWQSQDYPWGRSWNDADHRRVYPGDKAFEYAGTEVLEVMKP
jgi:hypothetical protein